MDMSLDSKVALILKNKEVEYDETNGNIHIFQAVAHAKGYDHYIVTAEIKPGGSTTHPTDYIEWQCDVSAQSGCRAYRYNKDRPRTCKHIGACQRLMKSMGLRVKWYPISFKDGLTLQKEKSEKDV